MRRSADNGLPVSKSPRASSSKVLFGFSREAGPTSSMQRVRVEGPFVFGVVAMTRLDCFRRKVCWAKPNHAFSVCQQFRKVIFVRSSPALALAHRLHATRAMLSSASRLPGVRRLFSKRRKKCGLLLFACRGRCERACCVRTFDLFARRLPVSKHSSRGGRAATPLFDNARVRMRGFARTFCIATTCHLCNGIGTRRRSECSRADELRVKRLPQ